MLTAKISLRLYSHKSSHFTTFSRSYVAPSKRYTGFRLPGSLFIHKVPAPAKWFSGFVATALSLTHFHPDTLITLGPPILIGGYFAYRRINHQKYVHLIAQVVPKTSAEWSDDRYIFRIESYDESDVRNVLNGYNNKYEHFTAQVVPLIEERLKDVVEQQQRQQKQHTILMDSAGQFRVNLGQIETFVTSKAEVPSETDDGEDVAEFITMLMPLWSSREQKDKKRLATLEVSMLKCPSSDPQGKSEDYRVSVGFVPFRFLAKAEAFEPGTRILESAFLKKKPDSHK